MEEVPSLTRDQEEADTQLIWRVKHTCEICQEGNIIIQSSGTDVLVILLTHAHNLPARLWLDAAVSTNNSRRYIDVSKLAENMGSELLCGTVSGLHVFTGCNFTASFASKVCGWARCGHLKHRGTRVTCVRKVITSSLASVCQPWWCRGLWSLE